MAEGNVTPRVWVTVTVLAAVIGCIGTIIAAVIGIWPDIAEPETPTAVVPQATPTVTATNAPDAPASATPQPSPTTRPTPIPPTITPVPALPVSVGTIVVPGNAEQGIRFIASQSGHYIFTYMSGVYSPWPTAEPTEQRWRTRISVYTNRPIVWEQRPYNPEDDESIIYKEPRNADIAFGSYDLATESDAVSFAQAERGFELDLKNGDYLIFVPSDDLGWYNNPDPNIGEIEFDVSMSE